MRATETKPNEQTMKMKPTLKTMTFTLRLADFEKALAALWLPAELASEDDFPVDCIILKEDGSFSATDEEECSIHAEDDWFNYLVVARKSEGLRKFTAEHALRWACWLLEVYAQYKGNPSSDPYADYGNAEVMFDDGERVTLLGSVYFKA